MPEPVGMEQRGQQLHAIHQAGAGAVEVGRTVDGIDCAGLDGRQVLPPRAGGQEVQFGRRPVDAEAAGHEYKQIRSEEHTSELQSRLHLVCRLLLEKKKNTPVLRTRPHPPPGANPEIKMPEPPTSPTWPRRPPESGQPDSVYDWRPTHSRRLRGGAC